MSNAFSDYWYSPKLKELRYAYSEGLKEIERRYDLIADEKSVLMDEFADGFAAQHSIEELCDADGNNALQKWVGYVLRSGKRMARMRDRLIADGYPPEFPDVSEEEQRRISLELQARQALEAVEQAKANGVRGIPAAEAIAMLEDDDVMNAMAEKYGSNSAVKMQ